MERKRVWIGSAERDPWDRVCRSDRGQCCSPGQQQDCSALPFRTLLLSLQCVSNPPMAPKLHLTPITQVTKLLYLGLGSVFFL